MKKIMVVTSTRADYGLLRPVIKRIHDSDRLELCLVTTGTHLMEKYGNTVEEIEKDGFSSGCFYRHVGHRDRNGGNDIVGGCSCWFQKGNQRKSDWIRRTCEGDKL